MACRDPRLVLAGRVIENFAENVDIAPTLGEALGLEIPAQFDGRVMTPMLEGRDVEWRTSAHSEWDYRAFFIGQSAQLWHWDRSLSRQNLVVATNEEIAYVQFGDGSYLCFDLLVDPTWRTACTDLQGSFTPRKRCWYGAKNIRDETSLTCCCSPNVPVAGPRYFDVESVVTS